ncbi:GPW/gp25 family protein [Acinetobacter sp. ESBL14]|uniref:GPW/gp25 family protein n=1 Tax=Acinetobacter sp. ESBL14 TaxID=3077329 RepID=UPI002FC68F85
MINKNNGQSLKSEIQSLQQSIQDIISTPIGSRVMRREYGSLLFELLDQPINDSLILKCYSTIYTAITRWEDRIQINKIYLSPSKGSQLVFEIDGNLRISGQHMNLRIPLKMGASS